MKNKPILENIYAQKQKIQQAQQRYFQEMTEENGLEWFQRNMELGDLLQKSDELNEAKSVYEQMYRIALELLKRFNSDKEKRRLVCCYQNLGNICLMQKNYTDARSYYLEGTAYCEEIFHGEKVRSYEWQAYYDMLRGLGNVCREEKQFDEAKFYFEQSVKHCRNLLLEYKQTIERVNLSILYWSLAEFNQEIEKPLAAKLYFQQCIQMREQAFLEDWQPTGMDLPVLIAEAAERLGKIFQLEKNYKESENYLWRAVELRQQRFMETRKEADAQTLSNALEEIGITMQLMGIPEGSLEYLHQCLHLRIELFQAAKTEERYEGLGFAYYNLAMGSTGESRCQYARCAYAVWDELCKQHPDSEDYRRRMAAVVRDLMDAIRGKGEVQ